MDRDAAKEQVARLAADLLEWSQRNRARLTTMVRDEVRDQLRQMGVASQEELDALRKRVRDLERSQRARTVKASTKKATSKAAAAKTTRKTSSAKRSGASTA
jgi:polyhydroxyalkanoate synthesis regulator phasin